VAGYDPLDPRQRKTTPDRIEVLATLADGIDGMRAGVLTEGFDDVDRGVHDVVTAAVDVLASAGADVEWVSVPEHRTVGVAARALSPEGVLGILRTGIYGAFARTHYPSEVIAAVNRLWRTEPERIVPRTVVACLVGELSRRAHHGRVYAKAHNVRGAFVRAYDAALDRVDVLVMPTTRTVAPPFEPAPDSETALRASLKAMSEDAATRNTAPFNYTGHPALAVPCGRDDGLPVSMQIVGRCFEDPLLLRVAFAFEQSVAYDEIIAVPSCAPPKMT
jgi:amidase